MVLVQLYTAFRGRGQDRALRAFTRALRSRRRWVVLYRHRGGPLLPQKKSFAMAAAEARFDPARSMVAEDKFLRWLSEPVSPSTLVSTLPGVGEGASAREVSARLGRRGKLHLGWRCCWCCLCPTSVWRRACS